MSEWTSLSLRTKLWDAICNLVKEAVDEAGLPRWEKPSNFVEEAVKEKLRREVKK